MKELKQFPTTDYNKFPQKYYFESIAKNIIKIGNLKNTNKIILDFGCGQKIFSKILKDKKIINYDIKPEYTECQTYEDYSFDIAIFNHVLMYLYPSQIVVCEKSERAEILANLLSDGTSKLDVDLLSAGAREARAISYSRTGISRCGSHFLTYLKQRARWRHE